MRAAVLALLFTFDPSPSSDIAGYRCVAWERHVETEPGFQYRQLTTSPIPVPCQVVRAAHGAGHVYEAYTYDAIPFGAVHGGCVLAFDYVGNESECIGGSS